MTILPVVFLAGLVFAVGAAAYYAIKNQYPQIVASWFFLKEDEPNGTVLPFSEIKNRLKELLEEYTKKR